MRRWWVAVPVALLLAAACQEAGADPFEAEWTVEAEAVDWPDCPRPALGFSSPGQDVVVTDPPEGPPCHVVAVPSGVELSPSDGSRPDPGSHVVTSETGRFFTSAAQTAPAVLAWDSDGTFLRAHDRQGDGPGELAGPGSPGLFVGPGDSVYVLDAGNRWSVFTHDLDFARVFRGTFSGRLMSQVHVTDRGIVSTGRVVAGGSPAAFHLMDFEGEPVGSFGTPFEAAVGDRHFERSSALSGRGSLWIAPPDRAPTGLRLEEWTLDGDLLRTLHRRTRWLPDDGFRGEEIRGYEIPAYLVHVDQEGLLWIVAAVPGAGWAASVAQPETPQDDVIEVHLEVIDPDAGVVLAAHRYHLLEKGPDSPFLHLFAGTRRSHRAVRDSLGLATIQVLDLHLVGRN
jgi:hypothetical protein